MNDLKPLQTENLPNTNVSHGTVSSNNPVAIYLLVRFLTFLIYIICSLFISQFGIYFVVVFLIEGFQLWFIKNVSGLHLVGLKWMLTAPNDKGEFFQFFSRPPPYIPISYQTNIFWFGCFFSVIFWICAFIICLTIGRIIKSFAALAILCAEIFNLVMFAKAHNRSKLATENDALAKLLDNPIAIAQMELNSLGLEVDFPKDIENPPSEENNNENIEQLNQNNEINKEENENSQIKQDNIKSDTNNSTTNEINNKENESKEPENSQPTNEV